MRAVWKGVSGLVTIPPELNFRRCRRGLSRNRSLLVTSNRRHPPIPAAFRFGIWFVMLWYRGWAMGLPCQHGLTSFIHPFTHSSTLSFIHLSITTLNCFTFRLPVGGNILSSIFIFVKMQTWLYFLLFSLVSFHIDFLNQINHWCYKSIIIKYNNLTILSCIVVITLWNHDTGYSF